VVHRVLTRWVAQGECWISTYSVASHGYAQIGWFDPDRGKTVVTTAHRVAWWAANQQPIPPGYTIDHICRVRPCVNPKHLRLLPNSVNAADNGGAARRNNPPTGRLCKRGHPLVANPKTPTRTYCRDCANAGKRRRRAEGRA
jgi:hypothetical protein